MRAIDAEPHEETGGRVLEDTRPDPALDVRPALPLDDQGVDAGLPQQVAEHEPGRAGTDDGDLGLHAVDAPHYPRTSRAAARAGRSTS